MMLILSYTQCDTTHTHKSDGIFCMQHCLDQLQGDAIIFKRRIREQFDEIKNVTEANTAPHFNEFYRKW